MSDVSCPRCGDSFRMPDVEIPQGAAARCPWCMDVFPVSELISALPPIAQLIDASGQTLALGQPQVSAAGIRWEGQDALPEPPAASELADRADDEPESTDDSYMLSDELSDQATGRDEPAGFAAGVVAATVEQPSELSLEGESFDGDFEESFDFTQEADEADTSAPVEPRPLHDVATGAFGREDRGFVAGPRAKKKAGSPLKSIVGVVAGGVLAIPLTAGILALMGKPLNLGFWPLDGRTIATGNANRSAAPVMQQEDVSRPAPPPRQGRSLADDLPAAREVGASDAGTQTDDDPREPQVAATATPGNARAGGQRDRGFSMPRSAGPELIEPVVEDDDAITADQTPDTPDTGDSLAVQDPAAVQTTTREPTGAEPATVEPEMQPLTADSDDIADEAPIGEPATRTQSDPEPVDANSAAEPAADSPTVVPADTADPEPTPAIDPPAVVETMEPTPPPAQQQASSPELQAALDAADDALTAVTEYDDEEEGAAGLKRRLATLYAGVAAVGDIARPDDEPQLAQLVDRLIEANLIKDLGPAAPNWARYSRRPNDGMLAVGPLRRDDQRWLLDWAGPTPLEVRLPDPDAAEEHARVLVLGRMLPGEATPTVEAALLKPLE